MKNQYFGDIGDYGKYGLLRFIADRCVKIAVNWYLTPDDNSNDGNIRGYLEQGRDRIYEPVLFDVLKEMCAANEKDVRRFAERNMIPGATYCDSVVQPFPIVAALSAAEKRRSRDQWHQQAIEVCKGADLVFLDPDNGLRPGDPTARKDASKYVFASEVRDYYEQGMDVVYYCHKGRRTEKQWKEYKRIMSAYCPDAALMGVTFHRGTQRSYIFVIHQEHKEQYCELLKDFLDTSWNNCFSNEVIAP